MSRFRGQISDFFHRGRKILLPLLVSTIVIKKFHYATAIGLADRWALPDVPVSFSFDDTGTSGFDFNFVFPVSRDVATHSNVDASLYDKGCKYNDGDPPVELLKGTSDTISFPESAATSTAPTVMTDLDISLGTPAMNVAALLKEYPTLWDEEKSQISFCVRFSLETDGIEVNFLETLVTVNVILEADFKIKSVAVDPKEKIEAIARVSFKLKAYLCDGQYRPLREERTGLMEQLYEVCDADTGDTKEWLVSEKTSSSTESETYEQTLSESQQMEKEKIVFTQGSVIRVCIRPDDAVMYQVSMRTIDKMFFEGTMSEAIAPKLVAIEPTNFKDMEKLTFSQVAVKDGSTDVSYGLSEMSCNTNRLEGHPKVTVCAVDTLLVSAFYWRSPGNPSTVTCYGVGSLQFGIGRKVNRDRELRQKTVTETDNVILEPELPHQRKAVSVSLADFWNMKRPKVVYSTIDSPGGGFDFNMEYTVSDAISKEMVRVEVWKKNCEQDGENPEMEYSMDKQSSSDLFEITASDAYETGDGSGTQIVKVDGKWKRDNPDFAPMLRESDYYRESSDRTFVQVAMCVRYQLHTKKAQGAVEVNFLETPVILNIDMKAGIQFGIEITLVNDEDPCIDELERKSGGRGGFDDLFAAGLYWTPGGSTDPLMPLGPPNTGSSGSGSWHDHYSRRASANTLKHTWTITIGICLLFVWIFQ